jgi:DNA-binding transcriptional LysR family regulator
MIMSPSSARRRPRATKDASGNLIGWLETFRVVVSTGHFTSAALQLGCSQSTVTEHVKALERQLRVTLIERYKGSQNIVLTDAGRCALSYATQILTLANRMKAALKGACMEGDRAAAVNEGPPPAAV